MLVFSTSDKGGTGRSVTSCNIAYWLSMAGHKVAYLDFDFGSPTAGGTFEIGRIDRGVRDGSGLHEYLQGRNGVATRVSVRSETDRQDLRKFRHPSGRLVLFPGDRDGGEFDSKPDADMVRRCTGLLADCESEFDVTLVDLSAGRSIALELVLRVTRQPQLESAVARWLVFHRWTRQHLAATNGLVHGDNGIMQTGAKLGHQRDVLLRSLRYVRTAVPDLTLASGMRAAQAEWLQQQDERLHLAAIRFDMGDTMVMGTTPVEPVLQCREQVILDVDVAAKVANHKTVEAFQLLANQLTLDAFWEPFRYEDEL
ncbi:SCO2523 family variant P-loop protein [Nocardia huaxiensis]|uniref:SCO2523 family variant P-loop protein n=1 Tax=Nocardia huaxiensis TaxID=2755382 RepID=UPI001E513482|nr:SCO2523 family variant P-loop protein [Nocardia huaxiensis]UFS94518.1 SCO2523 family variant P-loop protein [Nocardia huaxiensis]